MNERILYLREFLHRQNHNYYVLNAPAISDREYDALMRELQDLEAAHPEMADENSPTQRVGSDLTQGFARVRHERPMLSLGNTYSEFEVADFIDSLEKSIYGNATSGNIDIMCELKFDGTSISLIYDNGRLVQAATRGNGQEGDDVTRNAKTIHSIPLVLTGNFPTHLEMRGEVVMPREGFDALNRERIDVGEEPFANPRNAASGSLKLQNSAQAAKRPLDCILYYVLTDERNYEFHSLSLDDAENWGFKISPFRKLCHSKQEVFDYIHEWAERRKSLPFDIDGIVLKLNNLVQQQELGFTAKSPRWAVSYKFEAEQAHSKLIEVTYQVGRTGTINPVANMEPMQLAGTIVRRATLHNADIIRELDLHEEDTVVVEKGGEIIPKIVGVDVELRPANSAPIAFPTLCPECGTPLIRNVGEAAYYCPNAEACRPQIIGRLQHFVSRKAMNIDSIGEETVAQMVEKGLVSTPADFYALTGNDLLLLDGFKEKSIRNILAGIEQSKSVPYERVLFAIGIRYVGETSAKKLAAAFPTIDSLIAASIEQLQAVDDVGERVAQSIALFFSKQENLENIQRLRAYGLQFEGAAPAEKLSSSLNGLKFVISGVFAGQRIADRDELKAYIESHGGKMQSSVSAKTDYLVAGENMGPAKLEKAQKLGVKIISQADLFAMTESNTPPRVG